MKNLNNSSLLISNRRNFIRNLGLTGLLMSLPEFARGASFYERVFDMDNKLILTYPKEQFKKNKDKNGIIGPFGEVIFISDEKKNAIPGKVIASDNIAEANLLSGKMEVRIGKKGDPNAILFNSDGIQVGAKKFKYNKKDKSIVMDLINKDPKKQEGVLLLKAALLTSFPAILQTYGLKNFKKDKKTESEFGRFYKNESRRIGNLYTCETQEVIDRIWQPVYEEVREIVSTAEEQLNECIKKVRRECRDINDTDFFVFVCATGVCSIEMLVDIVKTTWKIVSIIYREVINYIVECSLEPIINAIPNPYAGRLEIGPNSPLAAIVNSINDSEPDVESGKQKLTDIFRSLPELLPISCILGGNWTLEKVENIINIKGVRHIPYGVKVCIDKICANKIKNLSGESSKMLATAWVVFAALTKNASIIAAAKVAASVAIGEAAVTSILAVVTAAIASIPPAALAAMIIIIALIILILYYSVAVGVQISYLLSDDDFADNSICIVHPSIAVVTVFLASGATAPTFLFPPIVTG